MPILAVASVGAIAPQHAPGDLVLPHQLVDYSTGREATFFDGGDRKVVHVDFTHPYTPALRQRCLAAARNAGIALHDGGVYAAVSGPRLETAAEIDRLERDGATLVGMTGMPETVLAREAWSRLCFHRGGGEPCGGSRRQRTGDRTGPDRRRAGGRHGEGTTTDRPGRAARPHVMTARRSRISREIAP